MWHFQEILLGILKLGIETIIIFSQQGGVGENFVHNPSSK
jgi:hypothetical protein